MRRFTLPGLSMVEILVVLLLLGGVACYFAPIILRNGGREVNRGTRCEMNQRMITQGIFMYAYEHDNKLPPANRVWRVIDIDPKYTYCKYAGGKLRNTYGFNATLGEESTENPSMSEPNNLILTAEIKDGHNNLFWVTDNLDPRHSGALSASYLDGHTEYIFARNLPNVTYLSPNKPTMGKVTMTELTKGFDFRQNRAYGKTLPSGWAVDRHLPGHPLCGVSTRMTKFAPSLCFLWARDGNVGKGYREDIGYEGLQVAYTDLPTITADTGAWLLSMRLSTVAWGYWSPEKQSATSIRTLDPPPCIAIYDDSGTDIQHPGRLLGLLEFRVTNKNDLGTKEQDKWLYKSQVLFNGRDLMQPERGWHTTETGQETASRWCLQRDEQHPGKGKNGAMAIAPFWEFNHYDLDQADEASVVDITLVGSLKKRQIICDISYGFGSNLGTETLPYQDPAASGVPKMLLFRTGNADGTRTPPTGGACMYQLYRKPDGSVITFSTVRK